MCRVADLRQAVLAKNDASAHELRAALTARGTAVVNLLSSPGSGKTALLEQELLRARERSVPVAALSADLATENDAVRLARSGVPVKQVLTDGLCHLEAGMLAGHLDGWLPDDTRLLFVENVGNLVCPASYDLGETLRVTLASVTEGEDKPLKYPTAFGLAQLVVVTKTDLAEAVEFDEVAFRANVQQVNPGVEVVMTSARRGRGSACCSTGRWPPWTAHPSTRRSWPGRRTTTVTRMATPTRTRRPPVPWPAPTRERSAGPGPRRRGHAATAPDHRPGSGAGRRLPALPVRPRHRTRPGRTRDQHSGGRRRGSRGHGVGRGRVL